MQPYFQLDPEVIYLNHAAVSPWPQVAADAVKAFADENAHQGSKHYDRWLLRENSLKEQLAQLINAPSSDQIALLKSTSEGLSVVAYGLPWQAGDNVVIPAEEFPSNRIVWQSLQQLGVETRMVQVTQAGDPEQALIDAIDRNTRLLSCSSVQYVSGLRLDLVRLGQALQQTSALFCVDAIQSIGALRFDVQACEADFVVADGHKWMLGPEGIALFYCRDQLIDQLALKQYGWHMVEAFGDYKRKDWQPHPKAQRFECGSPNMLGITALQASSALLLDVGMTYVEQQVLQNAATLIAKLREEKDVEILSPSSAERRAGIVLFRKRSTDMEALYRHLQSNNVICALRGNGIRFSPHFYTTEAMLATAVRRVREFL